ncbi:GntR family transcriptional regulator [Niveispirillum fermenti]|uniref:GntR family transcriptional regulator n=1 Tax=Niveispirillum fermenti TaxID=1233113 RepID=UPI003A8635BD
MPDHIIPRSSLQIEVCNRLRSEIIEGIWQPGMRLQERLLCERFGISRSPLREAYQALAAEGLIEIMLNKGAVVTTPTPELTLQQYDLLQALEMLGMELACRNADDAQLAGILRINDGMKACAANGDIAGFLHANNDVHRHIVLASGNEPLIDAHLLVSRQIIRVQNLRGPLEHLPAESVAEHDGFLEALIRRDAAAALSLFKRHLKTAEENLRRRLQWVAEQH